MSAPAAGSTPPPAEAAGGRPGTAERATGAHRPDRAESGWHYGNGSWLVNTDRSGLTSRPILATCTATLMWLVGLTRGSAVWSGELLLVVTIAAAWWMRRRSLLVSVYLLEMSLYFGLFPLLAGDSAEPLLVSVVLLWALGMVVGASIGGSDTGRSHVTRAEVPGWPHVTVVALLIVIQLVLIVTGQFGLRAQLTLGLSAPTGILGMLVTATPLATAMLAATAVGARRRVVPALILAVAEAAILPLSAFRGATPTFLIMLVVTAALILPRHSPWRRRRRAIPACIVIAVLAGVGFGFGAQARETITVELHESSPGTWVFGPRQLVPVVANRLDLITYLRPALAYRDDPYVKEALSTRAQLEGFIPRFLWPEKTTQDYGERVSEAVFAINTGKSSSTVTTIGDSVVNFGIVGTALISVLFGLIMTRTERWVRGGAGPLRLSVAAGVAEFIAGQEAPLVRGAAGLVRDILVVTALWLLCRMLADMVARSPAVALRRAGRSIPAPTEGRTGAARRLPPVAGLD